MISHRMLALLHSCSDKASGKGLWPQIEAYFFPSLGAEHGLNGEGLSKVSDSIARVAQHAIVAYSVFASMFAREAVRGQRLYSAFQ